MCLFGDEHLRAPVRGLTKGPVGHGRLRCRCYGKYSWQPFGLCLISIGIPCYGMFGDEHPRTSVRVLTKGPVGQGRLRCRCHGNQRARERALDWEYNLVKLTHDGSTWNCGEVKLYFYPSVRG